ncbi:MFS transporter [Desulfopila inferna]|uniref:MFS transporter n=1 Tax=Desulfopila inferna TaxID=468528 RepID=UPI001963FF50|nr:MFS transporter [Desulfopila inferna]MBM9606127.1 MFS transporter [Desulfopila inferna]
MNASRANKSQLKIIYFTTILTICSLYAAQPIQPVFQEEFQLGNLQALLFTTLMMLPLGIAPLFYGFLLETFSAKLLVRAAVLILGLLELVFACSTSYFSLLLVRAIQGLMIPAILTSLMSYISFTSDRENVQRSIAFYIAATIVGGFLGRFLSGLSTELLGWRYFFAFLGVLLIFSFYLLQALEKDANMEYAKPKLSEITDLLRKKEYFWLYIGIFSIFFVFSAMMNFLPFALRQINPSLGEAGIGFLYFGYAMGIFVSLNSLRIIRLFGNETDAVRAAIVIFFAGTTLFFIKDYTVMFGAMFVFCTGLFMAHSLLSGFVNKISNTKKGIANGVYISFYYMGGTFGSFIPGYFFENYGWSGFLVFLQAMLLFSFFCIHMLKRGIVAKASLPS